MGDEAVLVIGGSAGAVEALQQVVRDLPADLPVPVLVSLHVGEHARSVLPRILSRSGPLPAHHPQDGEPVRPSRIYVAPPGAHLVVEDGEVRLNHGPRVNRHRPAVDVMFAAAARRWRERVVALVLSGSLDDGAVGAALVARAGGLVVVQDPGEALFDSMPRAAMAAAPGATALATDKLGAHVARLLLEGGGRAVDGRGEGHAVAEERMGESDDPGFLTGPESRLTRLTCPECGGALARVDLDSVYFYRCHVGHRYGPRSLEAAQRESAESALWAALALLEEHAALARSLADEPPHGDADDSVTDELHVLLRPTPDADVLEVRGVLTMRSSGELAVALRKSLLDRGRVLVDVARLRVPWPPAVKLFPAALAAAGGWPGARLVLHSASAELAALLRSTGTTAGVPVAEGAAEALALLSRRPRRVIRTAELPAAATAPLLARTLVGMACEDWGIPAVGQTAQVIASELATLAVEDGSGPSTLRLVLNGSGLTVGVRDGSPDLPYRPKAPRLGLEVIDALSSGHRVTLHPDGKTVWAHVPHPPPAPDGDG